MNSNWDVNYLHRLQKTNTSQFLKIYEWYFMHMVPFQNRKL